MGYPPREGDLNRDDLMAAADEALERYGDGVDVYFKFTCVHCGERCMFQEPNKLYESGECSSCGESTTVEYGGFMLTIRTNRQKE